MEPETYLKGILTTYPLERPVGMEDDANPGVELEKLERPLCRQLANGRGEHEG